MGAFPKKMMVSVNFSCGVFCLLFIHNDAARGLATHGLVQSDWVLHSPVCCFICEFKMTLYLSAKLKEKSHLAFE
jgi:hypothetical protein